MSSLPSGTITFLFTDIEGSTSLWKKFPQTMPEGLALHDRLVHDAIESHAGHVFQVTGDASAVCAAIGVPVEPGSHVPPVTDCWIRHAPISAIRHMRLPGPPESCSRSNTPARKR